MSRDSFYAVNISQDRWDEMFTKKEIGMDKLVCKCGHTRLSHSCISSDAVRIDPCQECGCREFISVGCYELNFTSSEISDEWKPDNIKFEEAMDKVVSAYDKRISEEALVELVGKEATK